MAVGLLTLPEMLVRARDGVAYALQPRQHLDGPRARLRRSLDLQQSTHFDPPSQLRVRSATEAASMPASRH